MSYICSPTTQKSNLFQRKYRVINNITFPPKTQHATTFEFLGTCLEENHEISMSVYKRAHFSGDFVYIKK